MTFRCLLLLAAVTVNSLAGPFVLPWNDSLPGVVTDFSGMNASIEPGSTVTVDGDGHFVANGRRIRFLGVNFAGDSPFMPTNKAEAVAARLAKFGINCVRFHHIDASWAYNGGILEYTSASSTNFNLSELEKVHFLVSRLKAHGVYSDCNLDAREWVTMRDLTPVSARAGRFMVHATAADAPVTLTLLVRVGFSSVVYEPLESTYR
jgi:hypothetical protein